MTGTWSQAGGAEGGSNGRGKRWQTQAFGAEYRVERRRLAVGGVRLTPLRRPQPATRSLSYPGGSPVVGPSSSLVITTLLPVFYSDSCHLLVLGLLLGHRFRARERDQEASTP